MEHIVEGTSLEYQFACSYFDENDNVQDCSSGVEDHTKTEPRAFYIEFVTNQRQVTYKFSMGNF